MTDHSCFCLTRLYSTWLFLLSELSDHVGGLVMDQQHFEDKVNKVSVEKVQQM